MFTDNKVPVCPECNSENVIPIVYGYPDYTAERKAKKGEILLGGCVIGINDPEWYCKECENKFWDLELI